MAPKTDPLAHKLSNLPADVADVLNDDAALRALSENPRSANAVLLAAKAKSQRGSIKNTGRSGDVVTRAELADALELVELLAVELAQHLAGTGDAP